MATSFVGVASVGVTAYCLLLLSCQMFIKHDASKIVVRQSYAGLLLMALSSIFSSLTYFAPRLGSYQQCYCYPLWSAALITYILSIYSMKAIYVTRIYIINKGSILGTEQTKRGIKLATPTLSICCLSCLAMMVVLTDGECHANQEQYGCLTKFHSLNLYIAVCMLLFDAVLFSAFCYKWYRLMQVFKFSEQDHKIPVDVIQAFSVQFLLTVTAIASCFLDSIVHLLWHDQGQNYDITMLVFLLDCTVVASCNFCMLSASQRIVRKWVCFWCRKEIVLRIRALSSHSNAVDGNIPNDLPSLQNRPQTNSYSISHATDRQTVTANQEMAAGLDLDKQVMDEEINAQTSTTEK